MLEAHAAEECFHTPFYKLAVQLTVLIKYILIV